MTKHIRSSFFAGLLSASSLLAPASTAHAVPPCDSETDIEVLEVTYQPGSMGQPELYRIDFRVRHFGNDVCGEPFERTWQDSWIVVGDPSRPCGAPLSERHELAVLGTECDFCWNPELGDYEWTCCEPPPSEGVLAVDLVWPRLRTANWRLVGSTDSSDPTCEFVQLQYFDAADRSIRFVASAYVDGFLGGSIDLSVNAIDPFDSQYLCFDVPECALVAAAIDVSEQCDGTTLIKSEGIVTSYEGESCRDIWQSRSNPGSRAIHRTRIDGTSGPVTMARTLPAEFESARWTVAYQSTGLTEVLADGPQPSGSVVTGSETAELSISAATAGDLGVYTLWGIPPGGSLDDAVSLDAMRLVADVGQPEFASEPVPAGARASLPARFTADAPGATGFIWRIEDQLVPDQNGWLTVGPYSFTVTRPSPNEVLLVPIYVSGGFGSEGLLVTCEAWNDAGGVLSYEAPLYVQSLPAYMYLTNMGPPSLLVSTGSTTGMNAYTVVIETSDDLGATWNAPQVSSIQHTEPGSLTTVVPFALTNSCAGHVLVRAQVSDEIGVVGSMLPTIRPPQLALSDCSPDDLDQTDFRCVHCPAQIGVTLDAGDGETNDPFTVLRTLPDGNWAVRWLLLTNSNGLDDPIPLSDGVAAHSGATISGSTTPALTISNPSWDDMGTYAMLVRNLDDPSAREFCADRVSVMWRPCDVPLTQSPDSVRVCPGLAEFTVEALSDDPDAVLLLFVDGFMQLSTIQGFGVPVDFVWDDPAGTGEEVSFTYTWESSTRWRITNYSAPANHVLSGTLWDWDPTCGVRTTPTNDVVLWHMQADECSTCGSDLDGSGEVDFGDVALVLLDYGPCDGCPTDTDGTAEVDFGDVALVLLDFGMCP